LADVGVTNRQSLAPNIVQYSASRCSGVIGRRWHNKPAELGSKLRQNPRDKVGNDTVGKVFLLHTPFFLVIY
jgi:hypothetical protein